MIWRFLTMQLIAVATTLTSVSLTPTTSSAMPVAQRLADRDCGDFASQAAAQRFFINAGGPRNDPHRLDADGDGIACDSNPCPCSSAQGGGDGGTPAPTRPPRIKQRAVVIRVIDGDTVRVRFRQGGAVRDVRVLGIDTPEVYGGTECHGPQASAAAKRMLPVGTPVLLVSDRSQARKDRYGRLLRYVQKRGTQDFGKWQVYRGNARVYVYNNKPFERARSYRHVQRLANRANRGLWGRCDGPPAPPVVSAPPVPPTEQEPVDETITRAEALLQCTAQGVVDLPLTQQNELEACIQALIG